MTESRILVSIAGYSLGRKFNWGVGESSSPYHDSYVSLLLQGSASFLTLLGEVGSS